MVRDVLGHRVAVGEVDIVEETAAEEGVGQFLFIVRGDGDDRAFLRGHRLVGLIDMEGHAIEFLEQIVREFDVGLVDLVDQQHGEFGGGRLDERSVGKEGFSTVRSRWWQYYSYNK